MQGDESVPNNLASAWKDQEEERVRLKPDQVGMKAREFEKKSVREYWLVLAVLGLFIAKAAIYGIQLSAPLIRIGWLWGVAVFAYIALRWARNGPPRMRETVSRPNPCIDFLRSELQRKRQRLLEIRLTLFLLFPGMAAQWWGGGPAAVSRRLGIDAQWYLRFQESPALLFAFVLLLVIAWIGFGREARAIAREIESLGSE